MKATTVFFITALGLRELESFEAENKVKEKIKNEQTEKILN
jgi:hypothetical protein